MAQGYFDECFPLAMQRFELSKMGREEGFLKPAAFDLHQSSEFLYHCVLLLCSFYTPHVHNLGFLRTQAERLNMRLVDLWPREVKADRARFETPQEETGSASWRESRGK